MSKISEFHEIDHQDKLLNAGTGTKPSYTFLFILFLPNPRMMDYPALTNWSFDGGCPCDSFAQKSEWVLTNCKLKLTVA